MALRLCASKVHHVRKLGRLQIRHALYPLLLTNRHSFARQPCLRWAQSRTRRGGFVAYFRRRRLSDGRRLPPASEPRQKPRRYPTPPGSDRSHHGRPRNRDRTRSWPCAAARKMNTSRGSGRSIRDLTANEITCALVSIMVPSTCSNQTPDTLMQDRIWVESSSTSDSRLRGALPGAESSVRCLRA
jgi:hypothetical protein